ncbi:MAG: response regulator transcription factor [Lachnospiraceae bacterium]|nr:response regulator transcription factor [Lachnospiraceae bacterium]
MIYLLEDDESIRKMLVYALKAHDYSAEGFDNAESFRKAFYTRIPSLVILDIMLPGEDGISVLKKLRASGHKMPVIMLTAKSSEYDKVSALDLGADDYITKPFGIMEFIARVKAVLRRSSEQALIGMPDFEYGSLRALWSRHEIYSDGAPVSLTLKEYELLQFLIRHRGLVLTRDLLFDRIWGIKNEVENRTLDVHIRTLRSKLGNAGEYIQTIRGVGYKFIGEEQ